MGSRIVDVVRKRKDVRVRKDRIERDIPGLNGGVLTIVIKKHDDDPDFPITRSLAKFLFNKEWNIKKK